jgi:hypothetical protein
MEDEYAKKQREDEEESIARARDEARRQQAAHYEYIKRKHAERDEYIKAKQAKRREEEEEARRQQAQRDEAIKQKQREDEEARRQQAEREAEAIKKKQREDMEKEMRRERYSRNRKKRAAGTREHRRTNDYKEGKEFVEEIKMFFTENFEPSEMIRDRVYFSEIMDLFNASRDQTTKLKQNFFRRHTKQLFLLVFPSAIYSMHKNRRCFSKICGK